MNSGLLLAQCFGVQLGRELPILPAWLKNICACPQSCQHSLCPGRRVLGFRRWWKLCPTLKSEGVPARTAKARLRGRAEQYFWGYGGAQLPTLPLRVQDRVKDKKSLS